MRLFVSRTYERDRSRFSEGMKYVPAILLESQSPEADYAARRVEAAELMLAAVDAWSVRLIWPSA